MNFRNLAMWAVIIVLTIGLYNMFKNPQNQIQKNNNIIFSEFLEQVDNGRVVEVEIQGNNIKGIMTLADCCTREVETRQAPKEIHGTYFEPKYRRASACPILPFI